MRTERAEEVREAFQKRFVPDKDEKWFGSYLRAVQHIQDANEAEFRMPEFQKGLWELEGVASVGMGRAVVVTGAYDDVEVVDALWRLR